MRRLALGIFMLECLLFGAVIFVAPEFLVETLNDAEPIAYGWIRWAGADLLAMGIGILLILRKPGGQTIARTMATVSSAGALAAFVWAAVRDEWDGRNWVLAALIALNALVLAGLFWPARPEPVEPPAGFDPLSVS